jgi:cytosine/adenosine deaminase-related metal-dependent hydrolase
VRIIHADHLLPGDVPPVADGAVVVDTDGTVVHVGEARDVFVHPDYARLPTERVHGVVFPGLVNAHTHLELSALRGRVPGGRGFVPWVEALIATRTELSPEEEEEGIEAAVRELEASGTVAVGEVTNTLAALHALVRAHIGGCIFHEVFGTDPARVETRLRGLEEDVKERVGTWPTTDLTYAIAPHTLFTLDRTFAQAFIEEARSRGVRTSLHLAEHPAERRALEAGEGPVVEWLSRQLRIDAKALPWPMMGPVAAADTLGALAPHVLLVHLTDARPEELRLIAERGAPVVLCPRSNLTIEAQLPPLLAILEAGILPALGTDSLASNASLDVLAEARALHDRFPKVPAWELLRMATWNGARALGRSDLGAIAQGLRPGLVAVDGIVEGDPCQWLLRNVKLPRRFVAGRRAA